jgi:hypothetical protein
MVAGCICGSALGLALTLSYGGVRYIGIRNTYENQINAVLHSSFTAVSIMPWTWTDAKYFQLILDLGFRPFSTTAILFEFRLIFDYLIFNYACSMPVC